MKKMDDQKQEESPGIKARGAYRRLLRSAPLILIFSVCAATFATHGVAGRLDPARVPDTPSYVTGISPGSLVGALSHYRTFGYPLFLRGVRALGRGYEPLPEIQLLSFLGATLLFWFALRRASASPWLAIAAVLPLPFAAIMPIANTLRPDFLSLAFTLAAFSLLILIVSGRDRYLWWIALGASVFIAYQLRPAMVFLIALIPLLGILWRFVGLGSDRSRLLRLGATLGLVTVAPYLAFCGLRLATVGHFGLVSFGGTNQMGAAICLADSELLDQLPPTKAILIKRMLLEREENGWRPLELGGDTTPCFEQYNDNIWRITMPVAVARLQRIDAAARGERVPHANLMPPPDPRPNRVVRNEILGDLARTIIRHRPLHYLQWIRDSLLFGLNQLLDHAWIKWPLVLLVLTFPVALLSGTGPLDRGEDRTQKILFLLAVSYFATYLLLVALVSLPYVRYFAGMILFLPSLLCVQLYLIWLRIARGTRRPVITG